MPNYRFLAANLFASVALCAMASCGDYAYDPGPTISDGSPAGSTTIMGRASVLIDGVSFSGTLATGASYNNGVFGFAASSSENINRTVAISMRVPGPGIYTTGSPGSPAVSYIESVDGVVRRWFSSSTVGNATVNLGFLSDISASGSFEALLQPDPTTVAAGITTTKFLTGGIFNVSMSR